MTSPFSPQPKSLSSSQPEASQPLAPLGVDEGSACSSGMHTPLTPGRERPCAQASPDAFADELERSLLAELDKGSGKDASDAAQAAAKNDDNDDDFYLPSVVFSPVPSVAAQEPVKTPEQPRKKKVRKERMHLKWGEENKERKERVYLKWGEENKDVEVVHPKKKVRKAAVASDDEDDKRVATVSPKKEKKNKGKTTATSDSDEELRTASMDEDEDNEKVTKISATLLSPVPSAKDDEDSDAVEVVGESEAPVQPARIKKPLLGVSGDSTTKRSLITDFLLCADGSKMKDKVTVTPVLVQAVCCAEEGGDGGCAAAEKKKKRVRKPRPAPTPSDEPAAEWEKCVQSSMVFSKDDVARILKRVTPEDEDPLEMTKDAVTCFQKLMQGFAMRIVTEIKVVHDKRPKLFDVSDAVVEAVSTVFSGAGDESRAHAMAKKVNAKMKRRAMNPEVYEKMIEARWNVEGSELPLDYEATMCTNRPRSSKKSKKARRAAENDDE